MKPTVIDVFPYITTRLEGRVSHMYLDCKGLVTVGLGCLIDPVSLAVQLPWVHKATLKPAGPQIIIDEWQRIKDDQRLAKFHYNVAGSLTQLRLTDEGIDSLAVKRLSVFETDLRKEFLDWDAFPADAQLAIMLMTWAMGSGFTHSWKHLTSACKEHRWIDASEQCRIQEKGNVGVIPRNKASKLLFAQSCLAYGPTDTGYDAQKVSLEVLAKLPELRMAEYVPPS
jgi:hypothetical protein